MLKYETLTTYPELIELINHIDERISAASCPPEFEIWNNRKFCSELGISVRKAAYLRATGKVAYSKVDGLIFYRKADVLDLMQRNRIESKKSKIRIR